MDAGGFYPSQSSLNPRYSYPPVMQNSCQDPSFTSVPPHQEISATSQFSVSQKLDFIMTGFEEHKKAVTKTLGDLKSEMVALQSEITDINKKIDVTKQETSFCGKGRKRVPKELSVNYMMLHTLLK